MKNEKLKECCSKKENIKSIFARNRWGDSEVIAEYCKVCGEIIEEFPIDD